MNEKNRNYIYFFILSGLIILLTACSGSPANYPHGKYHSKEKIFFSSFTQQPKTLDPAVSYSEDEWIFLSQIVEPPLEYQLLTRPFQLQPLTTTSMPQIVYLDAQFKPTDKQHANYTQYTLQLKPHIYYQLHPAFAKNKHGDYLYLDTPAKNLKHKHSLQDFQYQSSRELVADDYIYEIKRLAEPGVNSPIAGLMSHYILGFSEFTATLEKNYRPNQFMDLRLYSLKGVKQIDRYTYQIIINGVFQQFPFWLATNFFSPVPWEVDKLYASPALKNNNIGFNTYPVGTGPYFIQKNNPNNQIVLQRNPNFHHQYYPSTGEASDEAAGYLKDAGKRLPFIDTFVFSLEKENIPRWNKFLQGYYDASGIGADNFDQAVQLSTNGQPILTPELANKGIRLRTTTLPSIWYFAFNMRDPILGGYSKSQRELRQAISIAVNTQEYINIFLNGRGKVAYNPIPPGIEGFTTGKTAINPYTTVWTPEGPTPKSLAYAKQLLAQAGYPNGINRLTGKPLILHYDAVSGLGGDERAQFQWMQKSFAKLGIQLIINDTDYNRFRQKVLTGNIQIFSWGWSADYPDPENFLFNLYGPNNQIDAGGENVTNYENKAYDQLFETMKNMPNGKQRDAIIKQMIEIFQQDTPWFGIFYGVSYQLSQPWTIARKINGMSNNTLKYSQLDPVLRMKLQQKWNRAHYGFLLLVGLIFILLLLPFVFKYIRMQHQPPKKTIL